MVLSIIAAVDEDNVIGLGNTLPWDMPADMRHFREKTEGHPVIMGRRTFDSIVGKLGSPLPNRRNIVLTRRGDPYAGDVDQVASFDEALELARSAVDAPSSPGGAGSEGEAFVIGGEQVYALAMPRADRIYLTRIHGRFDGDKFFPPILRHEWEIVSEERREADAENPHACTFFVYERKR